jgi:hypothetical protein
MDEKIHELLLRNLQEVFGEGDPTKRRSAIKELYTEDCVVYVSPGTLVGHGALDKFASDLRAHSSTLCLHPPCFSPSPPQCRSPKVGLRPSRRGACLYG